MRRNRFSAITLLLAFPILFALSGCGGSSGPRQAGTAISSGADLSNYQAHLSKEVWSQVQHESWYNDGRPGQAGTRLLDVLLAAGPLWQDSDRSQLLDDYPDGIPQETWDAANEYARMSLAALYEVIRDPWLVDGVDGYEKAVLSTAAQRVVSAAALRRALADGLFRPAYAANPDSLNAVQIDAVGSLDNRVLDYLKTQPWFTDGLDSYEVSLLGIINTIVQVDDQIDLLRNGNYRRLNLTQSSIAVLFEGDDKGLMNQAFGIVQAWMPKLEQFLGPYKPTALIIDVTPDPNISFCHTGGGSEFRPSSVALPLPGCFRAAIIIHELAHAFIGGRYPPWFSEGIAETVTYHLTGARSGYFGGVGTIDLEGRYLLAGPAYQNQAALGSDFLEALYKLAGPEQMSAFIKDVEGRSMTGQALLDRMRKMNVDQQQLESLIATSFGLEPKTANATPAAQ